MNSTWLSLSNWCLIAALICFTLLLISNRPKGNRKMSNPKLSKEEFKEHSTEYADMIRTRFGESKAVVIEAGITGKMFLVAMAKGLGALEESNDEVRTKIFDISMDFAKVHFTYTVTKELGEDVPKEEIVALENEINHFMESTGIL